MYSSISSIVNVSQADKFFLNVDYTCKHYNQGSLLCPYVLTPVSFSPSFLVPCGNGITDAELEFACL